MWIELVTKRALLVYIEAATYGVSRFYAEIEETFRLLPVKAKMNAYSGSRPQDMAVCLWDHTDTLQEMKETTSDDLMLYTDDYNAN